MKAAGLQIPVYFQKHVFGFFLMLFAWREKCVNDYVFCCFLPWKFANRIAWKEVGVNMWIAKRFQ